MKCQSVKFEFSSFLRTINKRATVTEVHTDLGGTNKAGSHDFGNDTHEVFGFVDYTIDFGKSGRFAHSRVLDTELQLLYVRRDMVQVFQKLLLVRPDGNLPTPSASQ